MSSGKITRFQNNVRIDGDLDLSNSEGILTLSSLSSAPTSPTVGESYYDSTLEKARIYQAGGWSAMDGTAAGSLDAAYNGGATIAVDGGAVTLTDSQTNTAGGLLITKSGIVASSSSNSIFHINSTATHTSTGTMKMIELSCAADSGSQTQIGIEAEMAVNTDSALTVTKGAVTLTDGALTLSSGAFSVTGAVTLVGNTAITGTLGVSGTSTLAAIANSGSITSQGVVIIDVDNAEALLIRENGDAADVLTVDTTQDAGDTTMLLTTKVTTGTGFHIDGSTVTTGDVFKITVAAATMEASGAAFSVVADGSEVFAIRDDGSGVSIAGTAEGTTALDVTTGDLVIADGDLALSGGEFSVVDGVTTAGSGMKLTSTMTTAGVSAGAAGGLTIIADSATTGTILAISAEAVTTGDMLYLDAGGGTMTGDGKYINCNDDNTSVFSVVSDGSVTIAGTATGTAALTITAGDISMAAGGFSLTDTGADQFAVKYDASNHLGIDIDSDGSTTLTTTGTNADLDIATGTNGDITLTAALDIILAATGGDVNSNAPVNITVAGGSQLELIAAGSIKCVDSVANTTGNMTRTISGGTGNIYEIVADTITLDSAGDIAFEAGGADITMDAQLTITQVANDQFVISNTGTLSVDVDTDGSTTLTTAGTDADLEIVSGTAGDIVFDSTGDIIMEAGGADITMDAPLTITDATNESGFIVINNTITTTGPLVDISSTSITTASVMKLNANTAASDGTVLEIVSAGDTSSTPTGISVTAAAVTSGVAKGIAVSMALATTAAKGISVSMPAVSTGDMLFLDQSASDTMTAGSGFYINCNRNNTSDFTVSKYGAVTIAGNASGVDALTVTAGDLILVSGLFDMTVGDMTLADGSVTITDADAATSLSVTNNSVATADLVSFVSTGLTTGAMLKLNANGVTHDGEVLEIISAGDATSTPIGISVTMSAVAASTGADAAYGIWVDLPEATSGANGIEVRMDKVTTGDLLKLDNGGGTLTGAGRYINCVDDATDKFTVAGDGTTTIAGTAAATASLTMALGDLVITDSDANTISSVDGAVTLLTLDNAGGAIGSGHAVLKVDAGGVVNAAGYGIYAAFTGSAAAGATVVGIVPDAGSVGLKIAGGGVDTREALYIDADPTAYSVAYMHSDAILAADKAVLELHADTGESDADSSVLRIHQDNLTGASFGITIVQDDLDVPFINFEGTSSADENSPISSLNTGTTTDYVRCAINGAKAWVPVVTGALS